MAFTGICPYLKESRGFDKTVCECAKFTFPDKVARRDILYHYCGHPTEWENCTFKAVMDAYYERKYAEESDEDDEEEKAAASGRRKIKTELRTVGKGRKTRCSISQKQ